MIDIVCIGHDFHYEIKELLKLFFPHGEMSISTYDEMPEDLFNETQAEHEIIISRLTIQGSHILVEAYSNQSSEVQHVSIEVTIQENSSSRETSKKCKLLLKKSLFQFLRNMKHVNIPWGILLGIRPTKIVHELLNAGLSDQYIIEHLLEEYFVQEEKAQLLLDVAKKEYQYIYPIDEGLVSLYISVPFCPTRCLYCSFPSNSVTQWGHLMDEYVEQLCVEITEIGKLLKQKNKKIETLYIGGGTPTTLHISHFDKIFQSVYASFDKDRIKEITVEAGRPDTIDLEKLAFLKSQGTTRVSINPQTMNDCTLQTIGRKHSVQDFLEACKMARDAGFENINMDLIIGLPGEDSEMVAYTMKEIQKLAPTNLTVHTLAIKKGSNLIKDQEHYELSQHDEIQKMLQITRNYAEKLGLHPYYMYRQKHMLGNFENIGYSAIGYECIYNIQIMEEKQTIIAVGAGGVSKFTYPKENRLERVPNVKDLEHYIQRVDEMVQRKQKFISIMS
ncbi:Coproporphyrinogen dehydrogenase [Alkaliphilus metalliredigens QYMF]|uniref:Coproporphyrinogen dehydrogenase n=1 Tax=Alkaliphilus metalliredigens (strain QYMF) TaxID=293826 RepID=A6TQP3_ALKMQ|nr:coproporphyrinogen dehydrogenase HemZ [Alkaliphilus metalliredigens]ABR48511.1 Coproporphyrinogen dehydrogenase [Alkaliphilus metalliredigens QYMF]